MFVKVRERPVVTPWPGNCQSLWERLINAGKGQFQLEYCQRNMRKGCILH